MILKTLLTTLIFSCFFIGNSVNSQNFNTQQKFWLYKIVYKTPSLKRNWSDFITYQGAFPTREVKIVKGGILNIQHLPDWDLIKKQILQNPDLLTIKFDEISKSSPGLIADASVKLTLWELYSILADGLSEEIPFSSHETAVYFKNKMVTTLPSVMKKGTDVKEKYLPVLYDILNPSLPVYQKSASLSKVKKVSIQSHKKVLDKWHQLVRKYVEDQSDKYFNILAQRSIYFKGQLLAAGEGSGSSGLLREFENKDGGGINTGTGKGIGLFTYDMLIKKEKLVPQFETTTNTGALKNEPTLIHLSLWGIDSNKKPLIVIENKDNSYLLFADYTSNEICPDPNASMGISYMDRIEEFEYEKIEKPLIELNKNNGLLAIFDRENRTKDQIAAKIKSLELEIDSINKLEEINETAISTRKSKIDINLKNLTNKESKLSDLQRKISGVYQNTDRSEKKLDKMKSALGKNVQPWTKQDSIYTFADGTQFNYHTQDLIIYTDSFSEPIKISLLAASFSLESERKDEVQLYINSTGGVKGKRLNEGIADINKSDTLLTKTFYFETDVFELHTSFTSQEKAIISGLTNADNKPSKTLTLNLLANGVDTVIHSNIQKDKQSYQTKNRLENYKRARRVDIEIIETSNAYQVNITGFADAGNTRLSKLPKTTRLQFANQAHRIQSLNPYLSSLRVLSAASELENILNLDLSGYQIFIYPLNKKLSVKELKEILK